MALKQFPPQPEPERWQSWRKDDPVDTMLARYIEWRAAARAVSDAYQTWRRAIAAGTSGRFATYLTALDHEELSADRYAAAVADVERSLEIGEARGAG